MVHAGGSGISRDLPVGAPCVHPSFQYDRASESSKGTKLWVDFRSTISKYEVLSGFKLAKIEHGKIEGAYFFPPMILTSYRDKTEKTCSYSLLWRSFSRNSRIKYPINPHWLSAKTNPTKRSTCKWFVKIEMPTSSSRSIVGKIKFNPATRPGRHLT